MLKVQLWTCIVEYQADLTTLFVKILLWAGKSAHHRCIIYVWNIQQNERQNPHIVCTIYTYIVDQLVCILRAESHLILLENRAD